jgi:hypothetical protein
MLEHIGHQLMKWFPVRRGLDQRIEEMLVSSAAKIITPTLTTRTRHYRVVDVNGHIYKIFAGERLNAYHGTYASPIFLPNVNSASSVNINLVQGCIHLGEDLMGIISRLIFRKI